MATKKKTTGASQPEVRGLSDTKRWIYGFALLFFALFVGVAVVSYFIYWRDDQNVALWSRVLAAGEQPVMNWGGKLGAVLANYIVGDWFGLFGFCVPVVLVILSLRIMRFRPAMLRKSVRLTLILMILGSLTLGYLFGDSWTVFGSGLGGQQGIEVSRWLVSVLGRVGAGLLLLLSIILYAIYVNRNTISLLNRVGICSHGLDRAVAHLRQPRGEAIVGCNIGKNTATPCDQAPADYLKCFRNLYQYADYFTINVACDPGQKAASYQTRENITKILEPLFEFRRGQNQYRPILLKVSPDLSDETIDLMTDIMLDTPLDGMVAVNATVSREGVDRLEATRIGAGVVSGQPLTQRALEVVRRIHTRSQGTYPIIGVGGLMTPDDVRAMLDAGAALVQIYTGYIYNGPGYVREICRALLEKKAAEN